jgi:membrane protease YdiL (CAAX protease family)
LLLKTPKVANIALVYVVALICFVFVLFPLVHILNSWSDYAFSVVADTIVYGVPLLTIICLSRYSESTPFPRAVGLIGGDLSKGFLYAFAGIVVIYVANDVITAAATLVGFDSSAFVKSISDEPHLYYVVELILAIVLVGFSEETIYRGFITERLIRWKGALGVVIGALLFTSLHSWYFAYGVLNGLTYLSMIMVFGLVFGVVYLKSRTIVPLIVVHSWNDSIIYLEFLIPSFYLDLYYYTLTVVGLISILYMVLSWLANQASVSKSALHTSQATVGRIS